MNIISKKLKKRIFKNMKLSIFFVCVLVVGVVITIMTYAERGTPQEEIGYINFDSENYSEPYSYTIDKSIEWIEKGKLSFNLNVFSIDENGSELVPVGNSSSGSNTALDTSKNFSIAFDTYGLSGVRKENVENAVNSIMVSNYNLIEQSNNLADWIIKDAIKYGYDYNKPNIIAIIGFIPEESFSNFNFNEYLSNIQKNHPNLSINIVQYDIGDEVIDKFKGLNCNVWIANKDNINTILQDIVQGKFNYTSSNNSTDSSNTSDVTYDSFIVEEVIDEYYNIENDSINVSKGYVNVADYEGKKKIIWNLGNDYHPGDIASLNLNLTLKEQYKDIDGYYSTSYQTNTSYNIGDQENSEVHDETPIARPYHEAFFDPAAPEGCNISEFSKLYKPLDEVDLLDNSLSCDGYIFKGWILDDNSIIYNGNNYMPVLDVDSLPVLDDSSEPDPSLSYPVMFKDDNTIFMPSYNIHLSGYWSKNTISKSSEGTVTTSNDYVESTYPDKGANIVFSDICWLISKKNDDGSLELLYNGLPDDLNQCGTLTKKHGVVGSMETFTFESDKYYYFADNYNYDDIDLGFDLTGNLVQEKWNEDTYQNLIGKYFCDGNVRTCDTIYKIESYVNNNTVVRPITASDTDDDRLIANTSYGPTGVSEIRNIGYMYNDQPLDYYNYEKYMRTTQKILSTSSKNTDFYVASSFNFDNDNYSLESPTKIDSMSNSNLKNKYTFLNTDSSYSSDELYYIVKVIGSTIYYVQLYDGHDADYYNTKIYYGKNIQDNNDGTFTLTDNVSSVNKFDWSSIKYNYTCNSNQTTCSNPRYVTSTDYSGYSYNPLYLYGNSVSYNEETGLYTLIDKIPLVKWSTQNNDNVSYFNQYYTLDTDHHYSCFNDSGICDKVYYVSETSTSYAHTVKLENGDTIIDYVEDIIHGPNSNNNDSYLKKIVDEWYRLNLLDQTSNLVDKVFCYDRTVSNYGAFNKDGGEFGVSPTFNQETCTNISDMYTVSSPEGNRKLTYPIGIGFSENFNSDTYWTGQPFNFFYNSANIENNSNNTIAGIKPIIVLKPNYNILNGNGNNTDPFIIEYE